jgi:hypothetical protein
MIIAYQNALAQEETTYKWMRRSEFTIKKANADGERDSIYIGLSDIVRANLRNFDPALRDNALHVDSLLRNYGDITHTDYDAESAAIDSIVMRLNSQDYFPAAANLGLKSWIESLKEKNDLFKSYVDDAEQEQVDKPDISPRDARRQTDLAQRHITDRVVALVNLHGPQAFAVFADEFNTLVNHYNTLVHEHYGRTHVRTDISIVPSRIEPVGPQFFSGKPLHVIPDVAVTVTDREGRTSVVDLVFTTDFTVAYRDNVNPGTAYITIRGIGKYTGELVTSFNIIRN